MSKIMFLCCLFQNYMCRLFVTILVLFIFLTLDSVVQAQFNFNSSSDDAVVESSEFTPSKYGPRRGAKTEHTWVAGIELEPGSQLENVTITIPVPTGWFEQETKSYRWTKGRGSVPKGVNFHIVNNGAKEAVLKIDNLRLRNKLAIILEFDTINYEVEPPHDTDIFMIPKRITNEIAPYLKPSPKIEIEESRVSSVLRKTLREITNNKQTDWEKVDAIYRYVQSRVKYNDANKSLPAKGVKALLAMSEDKCEGDCKDICGLFVAMCRLHKIPARLVRLPEHCYAEFYLEVNKNLAATKEKEKEEKNKTVNSNVKPSIKNLSALPSGFWFPCQVAGTYCFGEIHERQIILQKGDSFPDPENPPNGKKQFITEVFEGSLIQGSPPPRFRFIHDVKDTKVE
ncbi:MAG: transglutaminase-like domain-containing protein [Planctomycetaceae bacterium]|nr:transglutaminase-like domain-containing protein [Planctomycetaceae bacterium]